ncbi:TPA: CPBP family glutamic-type intramembrane protease [Clostridium perfringens]
MVFRLYAFYELRKFSLKKQIIISSFIFSIVHLISPILYCNLFNFKSLLILLFTFSTGIFLAVIYTKNKNLIQVSLIHLFINISTSLIPIFFIDVLAINLFQSIISFIFLLSSFLIFKSIKSIS